MEKEEVIINKLDALKQEIDLLKEHIIDITLTNDDIRSLSEAEKDLQKGVTKRL